VHIKVEDSTSGEETDGEGDGDGEEATGGEGDGERWDEEEEDEEEAEDGRQQREQQMQSPGANFEGRIVSGAGAVALPRRARLPPGSYADTAVEPDTEDDFEEEEEEEEWGADEKEEEAEPRDERTHVPGAKLKGGSQAVCPPSLRPKERSAPGPGSQRGQLLRAPGRVADNTVQEPEEEVGEAGFAPGLMLRGGGGHGGSSRFAGVSWKMNRNKWQAVYKKLHLGSHTTEEAAARAYSKYLEDGVAPTPRAGSSQFKGVIWHKSRTNGRHVAKGYTWDITRRRRMRRAHTANTSRTESILFNTEQPPARSSRVFTGTRARTNGRRNARGHTWAITSRRKTRRGHTTPKLGASGAPSMSSRPSEPRALARAQAPVRGLSALRRRHRRLLRRASIRSALLRRHRRLPRIARTCSCRKLWVRRTGAALQQRGKRI
jgi:hypothetical protein